MSEALRSQLALLPDYLGNHLLLTVSALAIGLLLSLPLGIFVAGRKSLQGPVLAIAGVIQTIPSLALLALMVPLLRQIGFLPALIALVLYSLLPVIRNTVTGIDEVDPNLIEAGRGLGMTNRQLLFRVQLPLAMPTIIAGIRTATVWVVGIATLSTPVGATSLGNYIFSGLQTQNFTAVLVGCLAAAGLALALDGLIRLLQTAAERRSRGRLAGVAIVMLLLLGIGLAPLLPQNRTNADSAVVVIGAKTFTEQYILSRLMADKLTAAGMVTRTLESLGSAVAFNALITGRIDAYVEYSGTIWANYMRETGNPGAEEINMRVRKWLREQHGVTRVIPLGFENTYALAMSRAQAAALNVLAIDDLVKPAPRLRIGSDYEFFSRPEWSALQEKYGLQFAGRVSMDSSLMYAALEAGEVDIITAFSTDGRIAAFDLVVLDDTRDAFPPYDALVLIRPGDSSYLAAVETALQPLQGAIDNKAMRLANRQVDLEGVSVSAAAASLEHRLGSGAP
jgi:osmoprotectant transport system permease protein